MTEVNLRIVPLRWYSIREAGTDLLLEASSSFTQTELTALSPQQWFTCTHSVHFLGFCKIIWSKLPVNGKTVPLTRRPLCIHQSMEPAGGEHCPQ